MSGWVVALGTYGQLMLGYFLFMLVIFSGAGAGAPGNKVSTGLMFFLTAAMYLVPASSLISAGVVVTAYFKEWQTSYNIYWWYVLPIFMAFCYLLIFILWTKALNT